MSPQSSKSPAAPKEVWFYHIVRTDLERVLPDLLQKTLSRGWRALVRFPTGDTSDNRNTGDDVERWNEWLWTYDPASFLPHGTIKDGHVERQPVFLTTGSGNANGANVLFLANGVFQDDISAFERCIVLFKDSDTATVEQARSYWRQNKDNGYVLKYWQQTPSGQWELKTEDKGGAANNE